MGADVLQRLRRETELGGTLTLLPAERTPAERERHIARRLGWGVRYLELRDDLLDDERLEALQQPIPPERRLLSARRPRGRDELVRLQRWAEDAALFDWPLELGSCPLATDRLVLSLHRRGDGEPLADVIERLMREGANRGARLLKLAVPIRRLSELLLGHAWASAEPRRRVFLPASADGSGRWAWYRLWRGDGLPLNFVRERPGRGTAPSPDQPHLIDWLARRDFGVVEGSGPRFAAILGDPVAHSLTPTEQGPFFQERGLPVLRIRLTPEDFSDCDALAELFRLGLRAAAVTAPWKHAARAWLARHGGTWLAPAGGAPEDACNTLAMDASGRPWGTSTDGEGLLAARAEAGLGDADPAAVVLWGGGGTLSLLRWAFPSARSYSARSGAPREGASDPSFLPRLVVWALGASRQPGCAWPPAAWRPDAVLDLNYAPDSPGRRYATEVGARYVSGLTFFRAQAAAQRRFWAGLELR